jgi:hypothetical protein
MRYWLADDDIGKEVNLVIVPGKRQLKPIMVATVEYPMLWRYPCLSV